MKLRRLTLAGFKTFADKTEIELGDGVTAVVGPNGCGKSNIADALLWVLGEQNPRLLRGSETRDFIFTGSDRRKPLGMAEVRLTIDNGDHSIPVEFAEIEIARRIYRSGESRYAINGTQCRLKDIVDLFLDTGMGRGAYSFISQSEVDAVLSARPEDRRELFEEAAGVQKYRARKREALRKLETAEANLTRINDIVHELERQREPLRHQAEIAERYLSLTQRLRQIEVGVLVSEIQRADYELFAARRERDADIATVREADDRLAAMERQSLQVRERLNEAEAELEAAGISRQGAMTSVERAVHELQLNDERARSAETTAAGLDDDIRNLIVAEQAAETAAQKDRAALERLEKAERERRELLAEARRALEQAELAVAEAAQESRDRAQQQRRLLAERASREAALAACSARIAEADRRLVEIAQEIAAHSRMLEQARQAHAAACEQVAERDGKLQRLRAQQEAVEDQVRRAEDERAQAAAAADALRRKAVETAARLKTLEEIHASGEGLYQGVRSVLHAVRAGALTGEFSTVADALTVPERLRLAMEVALGSDAQSLICSDDQEARDAVAWLKAERKGRATFLPLNLLEPPPPLRHAEVARVRGAVGIASELVSFDRTIEPAVRLLLGRVVVFEDLDAAAAAARKLQGWRRLVTLDGDTLTPGGALTGGSMPARTAHLVSRKGEIDDLKRASADLAAQMASADACIAAAQAGLKQARSESERIAEQVAQSVSALIEARRDAASAERELASARARGEDLAAETHRVEQARERLREEETQWRASLAAVNDDDTAMDDDLARMQARADAAARTCDDARRRVAALDVEVGRLSEQVRAARAALARTERSMEEARASRIAKQAQREAAARLLAEAESRRLQLEADVATARARLAECEEVHSRWREERQRRLEESFSLTAAIKETTDRRRVTMDNLHEEELRIARLEVRLAQHAQRLADDYGMTMEEALAAPDPGDMDRDTVNEIVRLRRELRAMGDVNTGAAEEFRRLSERYEFLEAQRSDLQTASASLRETIAEIDRSTRQVFMETFDAVAAEFSRLFQRLFGGGQTRLILTDPDDLLETGIEVVAQPPGKRASGLALLSGGERALTAVALLFSFLAVRPSPFVLLDEVDAPLDGPNVEKFTELVTDFARDTQFLIITHNPTTMESAPRWYGVTMQEPGVSRVVSYCPANVIASSGAA